MNTINHTTLITFNQDALKMLIKECLEEQLSKHIIRPDPTNQFSDYFTRKEVIELLQTTKPTIISWEKKGLIIAHKIGNKRYYKKDELQKQLSTFEGDSKREKFLRNSLRDKTNF